jgi:hypothetical protein
MAYVVSAAPIVRHRVIGRCGSRKRRTAAEAGLGVETVRSLQRKSWLQDRSKGAPRIR